MKFSFKYLAILCLLTNSAIISANDDIRYVVLDIPDIRSFEYHIRITEELS